MTKTPCQPAVDFHCHIDLYPDHEAAINASETAGVYTLAVTTTPKAWPRNRDLTKGMHFVRAALGLHPQLAAERAHEINEWKHYLPEARYIGEVGLDAGPRFYKTMNIQKDLFRTILEQCAESGGKVLSVHSVRTAPLVLDMIEEYLPNDRGKVVLHWFTGGRSDLVRAASIGCYFSINAEMTKTERGRKLIAELPNDRLLTETDGPFTKIKGRPMHPTDVHFVVEAVAKIRNEPIKLINDIILKNLKELLS
ncbi:Qat anti-phage system TatD family nuclease QatD [uncultured Desulfosarcina sp.]|uniref:Qat anti-phage system TatD family nuclease QatD n=1 Tax=uncultured Desulfosarcina sp. TaxID=218289 RepID=UPI0029C8F069|nr:Qat anti-phage system TatD family nuclease QatD [uncultured Desulfosarcina sp.]